MTTPIYYDPNVHFWQDGINEGIYPGNDDYVYGLPYGDNSQYGAFPLGPDGYSAFGHQSSDVPDWYYPGYGRVPPPEGYSYEGSDPDGDGWNYGVYNDVFGEKNAREHSAMREHNINMRNKKYALEHTKRNFGDGVWRTQAEWDALPSSNLGTAQEIADNLQNTQNRLDAWHRWFRDRGKKPPINLPPGMPDSRTDPDQNLYEDYDYGTSRSHRNNQLFGGGGTSFASQSSSVPISPDLPSPSVSSQFAYNRSNNSSSSNWRDLSGVSRNRARMATQRAESLARRS